MPEESAGILIARARQLRRMSQVQLAEQLGVSPSTVANWERGEHYPLRFAHVIEEALSITLPRRPAKKAATSA